MPFKRGGLALAQDAGVPIVPLATVGGYRVLASGSMHIRPGRFTIVAGAPLYPADFADRDALGAAVRQAIEALVAEAKSLQA